jgi:UDP-N-acetyl-D-mannosaminuronate dehydrogenase
MMQNVSVIGLGKLGGSMAAGMASRGLNVIGVDVNRHAVDAVNAGQAPVQETGLGEMIAAHKERIRATLSTEEAVLGSDISFVIVPTPSDERGAFTLQYAKFAFKSLGQALKKKNGYHVIVLTSTVLPGATRHGLLLPSSSRNPARSAAPISVSATTPSSSPSAPSSAIFSIPISTCWANPMRAPATCSSRFTIASPKTTRP